ncbi:hypothetical protein C1634_023615 [Chryseobacterium viscerum]|uniref:Uncharacterized protein n=1 Tax=Chryseobacterium viscerum TaxID=1037377 RepID=A0A316WB87_9FLAO|nr:hypothetical protein C1634_023615 [Chryseobacterium viscerum]
MDKTRFKIASTISFIYLLVGTCDNLTGLHFEKFLNNTFCDNNLCEFFLLIFYSQSYLYGALFCGFLGGSDIAFIFCQIIIFIILSGIIYFLLLMIKVIQKFVFVRK